MMGKRTTKRATNRPCHLSLCLQSISVISSWKCLTPIIWWANRDLSSLTTTTTMTAAAVSRASYPRVSSCSIWAVRDMGMEVAGFDWGFALHSVRDCWALFLSFDINNGFTIYDTRFAFDLTTWMNEWMNQKPFLWLIMYFSDSG